MRKRDILLVLLGVALALVFAPALHESVLSWLLYAVGSMYIVFLWTANMIEEDEDDKN